MIDLCRIHRLCVARADHQGVWLQADDDLAHLPLREAPDAVAGDLLDAFIYRDKTGHLQATLREPLAQAGEFALLTVRSVGPHGAFLDWGLGKDLLAPFSLQPERMVEGRSYLVKVDVDEQGRPFANARLDDLLDLEPPALAEGAPVALIVRQLTDLGAKVIVAGRFNGLLYADELPPGVPVGTRFTGYVKRLRPDGKLDVTLRKVGAEGVAEARKTILEALDTGNGTIRLGDNSAPEEIRALLGLSKKSFKKAIGGLYRDGIVVLSPEEVRLKKPR